MKPDYQRFFLTELVALIQRKYKFEMINFIYEGKTQYTIMKPDFYIQVFNEKESRMYNCIFFMNICYFKITRKVF